MRYFVLVYCAGCATEASPTAEMLPNSFATIREANDAGEPVAALFILANR